MFDGHQFIELSPEVPTYDIDKPVVGLDLGTEYCYAGQYLQQNGKNYVKILRIGGNGRDKLWSGVAFEGKTIHVGEAAKFELSIRKQEKRPLNGAFNRRISKSGRAEMEEPTIEEMEIF